MAGKTGVRRHSHIFHSSNHTLSITTKAVAAVGLPLVSKVDIINVDIDRVDIINIGVNTIIRAPGLTIMQPHALRSQMVTFPLNNRLTTTKKGETIGIVF